MHMRIRVIIRHLGFLLFFAATAHAEIYGLVVGINEYKDTAHCPQLHGAVNDAVDIAGALQTAGAKKIIRLLNDEATYQAITSGWKELRQLSKNGDTIVFTYAGHGGREPERIPGTEEDHMDDTFLLANFEKNGPGTKERIIDNEINKWFKEASKVSIIFVADSCHSGTMFRSLDPRGNKLSSRSSIGDFYPDTANDMHPPPQMAASVLSPEDLPNVLFFSSSEEDMKTNEYVIGGQVRGALSWSFANAVRGHANNNDDSMLTKKELVDYVMENIRMHTDGQQRPMFFPRGHQDDGKVLFNAHPVAREDLHETVLGVKILGKDSAVGEIIGQLSGVIPAGTDDLADLVWDRDTKQVVSGHGDVVADAIGNSVADFQKVVDKFRLVHLAKQISERRGLSFSLTDRNTNSSMQGKLLTPDPDQDLCFSVMGQRHAYFVLFSLDPDGNIELIYPLKEEADPLTISTGSFGFGLQITPPFGAEHLVGFTSSKPLGRLISILENGSADYTSLYKALQTLSKQGTVQAGINALYSAPR